MKKIKSSTLSLHFDRILAEKDERELYSRNPHDYYAINYRHRIKKIISTVLSVKPHRVLEIGCAQGNISLQIAEKNIFTVAADIDPRMLSYSKMKYEKGPMLWVAANASSLPFKPEIFDCIILAEILEHCAEPVNILRMVFVLVKPGGSIIITTPNGNSKTNNLPSYSQAIKQYSLMKSRQFGPDGEDHLFAFRWKELYSLVKKAGFTIEKVETVGNHFLHLKYLYHLRHTFSFFWNVILESIVTRIPFLKFTYTNTLFVVAKKE